MLEAYAPDSSSECRGASWYLFRNLFRTTPEDCFDKQPMEMADRASVCVFDGRIDNRDDVRKLIGLPLSEVQEMSDGELFVRLIERQGFAALSCMIGHFAFACYEHSSKRLVLGRDQLGFRPIFWARKNGVVFFSSLPKGIYCLPGFSKEYNEERILEHLALLPSDTEDSFYKDIFRVKPACYVEFTADRHRIVRYWNPEALTPLRLKRTEVAEAAREKVTISVQASLRSSEQIATELSAGLDSSIVAGIAAKALADRGKTMVAITAAPRNGFEGKVPRGGIGDESEIAARFSAQFPNIKHMVSRSEDESILPNIQNFVEAFDGVPLNVCNMVWVARLQKLAASRGSRVLLTGLLGNEGISYNGASSLAWLLTRGRVLGLSREIRWLLKKHPAMHLRSLLKLTFEPVLLRVLGKRLSERFNFNKWRLEEISAIHPAKLADGRGGASTLKARSAGQFETAIDSRRWRVAALRRVDFGQYSTLANWNGVEWRAPLADLRVLEFSLRLPERMFLHRGQPRWLAVEPFRDLLIPESASPMTRGYQGADWSEALIRDIGELREYVALLEGDSDVAALLDCGTLARNLADIPSAGWGKSSIEKNYRLKLLRGLSAGAFVRYTSNRND